MKSKAEIITAHLAGLHVLDIGGCKYAADNAYERELRQAWSRAASRTVVDVSERADVQVNFNQTPLPDLGRTWDIASAFDVLEHLEKPVDVLRWIPAPRIIICLPNALSPLSRRMEEKGGSGHLYSFTPYTGRIMIQATGVWRIDNVYFTFGKWSTLAHVINGIGSAFPSRVGTGIIYHCTRIGPNP